MLPNAPIQASVIEKTGLLSQIWTLFFTSLVGRPGSAAPILTSGAFNPASMADADAQNSTIYYSTTASKLVFKDSAGVVHALY